MFAQSIRRPCKQPTITMTIQPRTRLEHVEVQTPDGTVRFHVLRSDSGSDRNSSGSLRGLDAWREPPKGLLRRILAAFKWD